MFYLFLAEGFEETEALACLDVMRRAKLSVQTVGVTGEFVISSHGVCVKSDVSADDIDYEEIEGAILPGGMPRRLSSDTSGSSAAKRRPASRALKRS